MKKSDNYFLLLLVGLLFPFVDLVSSDEGAVVQAVLYYSPTCDHCHYVINEVLMPMAETHGERLQILAIDVTQPMGQQLYQAAIERFEIPEARHGVPTLVVGEIVLVGGAEIPDQFPSILERGLAAGGISWPDIPDLAQVLPEVEVVQEATAAPVPTAALVPTVETGSPILESAGEELELAGIEETPSDTAGFTLAGVVLTGMVAAVGYAAWRLTAARQSLHGFVRLATVYSRIWGIPFLSLIGLAVASYLAFVEITHVQAVCGPVGECNIVQSSSYAQLFGIPVAVLGMLSYLAILGLWVGQRYLADKLGAMPVLGLMAITILGTLFSIYLTLLELFAIRAVCAWCLGSAVTTTLLMLLVVVPVTVRQSLIPTKQPPSAGGALQG